MIEKGDTVRLIEDYSHKFLTKGKLYKSTTSEYTTIYSYSPSRVCVSNDYNISVEIPVMDLKKINNSTRFILEDE